MQMNESAGYTKRRCLDKPGDSRGKIDQADDKYSKPWEHGRKDKKAWG